MGALKQENIPPEALDIHKKNDQFRDYITSLNYTVDSYNKIIKNASAEEKPLIQGEMEKIDAELEKGEKELKWNSPNIGEYILDIRKKVSDLETRLQKSKLNYEKIHQYMNTWKDTPLFKRSEAAKTTLLQLDDRQVRLDNRYKDIKETGQKIHDLVKENKNLLKVEDENSENWKNYTAYIDKSVLEGFQKTVLCTLQYFLAETDFVKTNPDPLFEAQLQLKNTEMVFAPSMNYGTLDGFYELLEGLVNNVYNQGSLIPRVAVHLKQDNYQVK